MALKTTVFLRRADRDDLDTVVSWREDPAFLLFLYGDRTSSPKQVREQIVSMLGRNTGHAMPSGVHLIIDSEKYGPVGLHSIVNIGWRNRTCNVDTYVVEQIRNSFISTVSFYRAIEYCFQELNMHRINLFVYAFNTRSWRIIEKKSQAKRELELHKQVARDGVLYDMYGYGLIRSDWERLREDFTKHFKGIDLASMIEQRKQAALAEEARQ